MAASTVVILGAILLTNTRHVPAWLGWILVALGVSIAAEFFGFHGIRLMTICVRSAVGRRVNHYSVLVGRLAEIELELGENERHIVSASDAGVYWSDRSGSLGAFSWWHDQRFIPARGWKSVERAVAVAYRECERIANLVGQDRWGDSVRKEDKLDDARDSTRYALDLIAERRPGAEKRLARWDRVRRWVSAQPKT